MGCTRFGEVKSQSLGPTQVPPVLLITLALAAPTKLDFCSEVLCVHASLILIYFGSGFNEAAIFPKGCVFSAVLARFLR